MSLARASQIYDLEVVDVPPVLPSLRTDIPNSVYKTTRGKSIAALKELLAVRRSGRPVLVGTTSVEASRAFSEKLAELGVPHELLSADPQAAQREAEVVAQAGREGAITISTNMAGRGTDILLGGNPAYMARLYLRSAMAQAANLAIIEPREGFFPAQVSEEAEAMVRQAAARFATSRAEAAAEAAASGRQPLVDEVMRTREELLLLDEVLAVAGSSAAVYENSIEDETVSYTHLTLPTKRRV